MTQELKLSITNKTAYRLDFEGGLFVGGGEQAVLHVVVSEDPNGLSAATERLTEAERHVIRALRRVPYAGRDWLGELGRLVCGEGESEDTICWGDALWAAFDDLRDEREQAVRTFVAHVRADPSARALASIVELVGRVCVTRCETIATITLDPYASEERASAFRAALGPLQAIFTSHRSALVAAEHSPKAIAALCAERFEVIDA